MSAGQAACAASADAAHPQPGKRFLIVKTSAMGDLVHTMPMVSDLVRRYPGARIDWVCEPAFADIARLHPAVEVVIDLPLRRWRGRLGEALFKGELRSLWQALRARRYDAVIDTQGMLKSAIPARLARLVPGGVRIGLARQHCGEPAAARLYDRVVEFPGVMHAVERLRFMVQHTLDCDRQVAPEFGLTPRGEPPAWLGSDAYVLCLHASSRPEKEWPAARWVTFGRHLLQQGRVPLLSWGNPAEQERAQALARQMGAAARVTDAMSLAQAAHVVGRADAVVGVDTGLTHLAGALHRPTVALFAATPSVRYGHYWSSRSISLGENGKWPSPDAVLEALNRLRG